MTTYSPKAGAHTKSWIQIDAKGVVLGRLAAFVASRLRGKHLPYYTPHADLGDYVVVVNADKVELTGNKTENKVYYRHTGYPGGIRSRTAKKILEGHRPQDVIRLATKRMLSDGSLGRQQLRNLRIYCGDEHPHMAQSPAVVDFAALNRKNTVTALGSNK